jgi:hypothetical protein
MPLVIFVLFTILCQAVTVAISVALDRVAAPWISVMAFGVLYIVAFAVAWKLTVWTVDRHFPQLAKDAGS